MKIAIIGMFQTGKSTLTNCIVDDALSGVGDGTPTTHALNCYAQSDDDGIVICRNSARQTILHISLDAYRKNPRVPAGTTRIIFEIPGRRCLAGNRVIDTPGFDSTGEDAFTDNLLTTDIVTQADRLILVLRNTQLERPVIDIILPLIRAARKPFFAVMNCINGNPDPDHPANLEVARLLQRELAGQRAKPCPLGLPDDARVLACNPTWWWAARQAARPGGGLDALTSEMLEQRGLDVANYFHLRGKPVPEPEELARRSHLRPLLDLLASQDRLQAVLEPYWHENILLPPPPQDELRRKLSMLLAESPRREGKRPPFGGTCPQHDEALQKMSGET